MLSLTLYLARKGGVMHMKIRGFIIVGVLLCLAGIGICSFAATRDDFVLEEVYTDPSLEKKEYIIQNLDEITYSGSAEDLEIVYTEEESKIIYYEGKYKQYKITEEEGNLVISQDNKNHFFNFAFFNFGSSKCTIYVNQDLKELNITMNAGQMILTDLNVQSVFVDINAGNSVVNHCTFELFKADVDAGNMKVKNTIVKDMNIDFSAGNFNFHGDILSSAHIYLSAGQLKLDLIRQKEEYVHVILDTEVDAGKETISYGRA